MAGRWSRILATFFACVVVVGCGGGGGGSSVAPIPNPTAASTATPSPTATPAPTPTPTPSTSTQTVNVGAAPASATFPTITAGFSGTATLPTATSGSSSLTVTFGSALPGGLPAVASTARMPRAIGVSLTPVAFFTFTSNSLVSFATSPAFTLAGSLSSAGSYYVGIYDATNGWTLVSGPVSYSGGLNMQSVPRATTFAAGTTSSFVIFSTVAPIPTPTSTATPTPTPTATPTPIAKAPTGTYVYVAGSPISASAGLPATIFAYPLSGSGPTSASYSITVAGITQINALAVDSAGSIYVGTPGSVRVYSPGSVGTSTPIRVISGSATLLNASASPNALAVGNDGTIYLAMISTGDIPGLLEFAPGSNGNVAPVRTLSALTGSFANPQLTIPTTGNSVALDNNGNVVVGFSSPANSGIFAFQEILTFPINASGMPNPTSRFFAEQRLTSGIAISGNQIYVPQGAHASYTAGINVYPLTLNTPNATQLAVPQSIISGSLTGITVPAAIAADSNGRLIQVNYNYSLTSNAFIGPDQILIFPAGASGNSAPVQTMTLQSTKPGSGNVAIGSQQ